MLARGFAGDFFYFVQPAILWQRLCVMGNVLTFQFSPWLLAGMGLGLLRLLRANRRLAWVMGGGFLLHTMITAMYRAPQTVEYMMPAYIPLALCLGYALQIPPSAAPWPPSSPPPCSSPDCGRPPTIGAATPIPVPRATLLTTRI